MCGWPVHVSRRCPGSRPAPGARRARLCPRRGDGAAPPSVPAAAGRENRLREARTFGHQPGVRSSSLRKKTPKNQKTSRLTFRLPKGSEKYPRWKAGLFLPSASIQARCTSQDWWANRLSLTARGWVGFVGWFVVLVGCFFFSSHGMIQLCQLGLFSIGKAKVSAMMQSTEEIFSLLKGLGKSHPLYNFIGFTSRWSFASFICPPIKLFSQAHSEGG